VECCVFLPAGRKEEDAVNAKRKVEIFGAGCPACREAVEIVRRLACPSCDVRVLDMTDPEVAARTGALGIRSVPAVAVDGTLPACCAERGPDEDVLRAAGVGRPLP
jgi:glutaredoxin 3